MKKTKEIGKLGEAIAREFLENKGYDIIEQNYQNRYAEIDLIAKKNSFLIFVEVRTKTSERFGTPEETLNKRKLEKVRRNAQAYAARVHWQGMYRIDAVCIVLDKKGNVQRLEHYEDI